MLEFLTGIQNFSKKKYISDKISQFVDSGKKVYLVVPEQSSFDREREFLFKFGEKKSNSFEIRGFSHIARAVLEENGLQVKPEADENAKTVIMSLALEQLHENLDLYSGYEGRLSLINDLLSAYSSIKLGGMDISDLKKVSCAVSSAGLKKKTGELSLLFSAYEALLGERFSDSNDNIRVLTEFLKTNRIFENCIFFLDDFRGFTLAQIKLIRELLCQCEDMYISVNSPDLFSPLEGEAFYHAVRNAKAVKKIAVQCNVRVFENNTDEQLPDSALNVWRESLFSSSDKVFKEPTDDITVCKAKNKYEECEFVALEIKKLLCGGKYRCREIGVVERGNTYAPVVINTLKKYGIPVYDDKRKPLMSSPLIRLILSAVNIAAFGFTSENILECAKTDLFGIDTESLCDLENYVYMWQIDGKAWREDFKDNPDGFGAEKNEKTDARLEKINKTRRKIVAPLVKLKKELDKSDSENSLIAVCTFLEDIKAGEHFKDYAVFLNENSFRAEALFCKRIWERCMLSLDALSAALHSKSLSAKRFYELLEIIFSGEDLGDIPVGIDQIIVGCADRSRFFEPKVIFVLGANEGVFPADSKTGGIFSTAEKRELIKNDFSLEDLPENIYAEERLIAFNHLTSPSEKLYISYSESSLKGEVLQKSEIVSLVNYLVPNCRRIDASLIPREEKTENIHSAFNDYAKNMNDGKAFTASLKKVLENSFEYSSRLKSLEIAAKKIPVQFENPEISTELFGKDLYLSPSKIETYHKCPFMFFCRYGLSVSAPEKAQLNVRIHGLLVHFVLEKILSTFSFTELKGLSDATLFEKVNELTDLYVETYMGTRNSLNESLNRQLDRSAQIIFEILKRLILEFGSCRFVTKDVELDISESGDIMPYELSLSDGSVVKIGGKVDRVDIMCEDEKTFVRVVDYKTGGKKFSLSQVFDGLNMQMLLYLFGIWENGKERYGDVVPAGVLYVPAKNSGQKLGRNADDEEVIKQKLLNGRMNGLVLEDENVIKGMDALADGRYIDTYIDKKGKLKGTYISLKGFQALKEKVNAVLRDTASDIKCGKIEALPVYADGYEHVCEYCDFKDVCLHEEGDAQKTLEKLSHEKALQKLIEEETENG